MGKSTLAEILAKEKSIPYISADDIASVIIPYILEQEYPSRLPLRTLRKETNYSNDIFYSQYATEQVVVFYLRQAETLWPGFENFIKYVLEDNHEYIVEGWQILPHLVHTIITPENEEKIKVCFLYKRDVDDILSGIKSSGAKNDWVINNTKEEATFLAIAKMISQFGNHIKMEAEKYNLKAVDMDFNFSQKIRTLSESL